MSKLVAILVASAFAVANALADGGDKSPPEEEAAAKSSPAPSKALPTKKEKQKTIAEATRARAEGQPPRLIGDFPPHYGKSADELRADQKRRDERWEKMTPKGQDEEYAGRKRRQ